MTLPIVLASASPYRRKILQSAGLAFRHAAADIDETPHPGETPEKLVMRLAVEKARMVSSQFPEALIIGSDQVACLDERIIGKPADYQDAVDQLRRASGRTLTLYAGLALINSQTGKVYQDLDTFEVGYRTLALDQIERYLALEQPYDCCGSLKAEGPGIALLNRLSGNDPNTLIGLPLIKLISLLEREGITLV